MRWETGATSDNTEQLCGSSVETSGFILFILMLSDQNRKDTVVGGWRLQSQRLEAGVELPEERATSMITISYRTHGRCAQSEASTSWAWYTGRQKNHRRRDLGSHCLWVCSQDLIQKACVRTKQGLAACFPWFQGIACHPATLSARATSAPLCPSDRDRDSETPPDAPQPFSPCRQPHVQLLQLPAE